jgi:hypothetical protein
LHSGIIADARSLLLKSQFAVKSSVMRPGDAAERNGKNAKRQARKAIEDMFGHFMRVRISLVGQEVLQFIYELFKCVLQAQPRRRQKHEPHAAKVDCAFAASECRKLEKCGLNFKSIHWRENPLENLLSRDSSSSKETETQKEDEGVVECTQTIHYLSPKSCPEGSGAQQRRETMKIGKRKSEW